MLSASIASSGGSTKCMDTKKKNRAMLTNGFRVQATERNIDALKDFTVVRRLTTTSEVGQRFDSLREVLKVPLGRLCFKRYAVRKFHEESVFNF